ncbi:MAG: Fe-S cluster domain-containing protein [Euryarchaeota archaeon]|nr:Fe-S cluster domain-containing protein [Euryarchaeota archaeon]
MTGTLLIAQSAVIIGGIGFLVGIVLIWASIKFAVEKNPIVEDVIGVLPGANCGACGYAGCSDFAEKVVSESAPINGCPVGGSDVAKQIGSKLGKEVIETESVYPYVRCNGGVHCIDKIDYMGIDDCRAVMMISDGEKGCIYGCIGRGTCVRACPFGAITIGDDRLPQINKKMCKSCSICIEECPSEILVMAPDSKPVHVLCRSHDKGKFVKSVCEFGCIGCRICVKNCPQKAITVTDFLAEIDQEKCNNCGLCMKNCPQKSIVMACSPVEAAA